MNKFNSKVLSVLLSVALIIIIGINSAVAATGTAIRTLPASYTAGSPVNVSINVTPQSGVILYSLEEKAPVNWTISNMSADCNYDAISLKVKCGQFFNNLVRTITYTATPPSGTTGSWSFVGTAGFDNSPLVTTGGSSSISPVAVSNFTLSILKSGTGSGTVSASSGGISCGSTCSASYTQGTMVTLTATPAAGSSFTGWSGACSGTGSCTVTMNSALSATANFTLNIVSIGLSVTKNGTGSGTVTSSPAGISCGTACNASFNQGTTVTLNAVPAAGSSFTGWSGACSGTGLCNVTLNQATNVTATFTQNIVYYNLSVSSTGTGAGQFTSSPAGINCIFNCTASFAQGTTVTITAIPTPDSTFTGWSGACSGTGTCTVTMNSSMSVSANFAQNMFTLNVFKNGTGSGTVTSSPAGISCGTTCTISLQQGNTRTLTATPAAGSSFSGWSGACSGTGTCSVTMNSNINVTATFTQNIVNYNLSVTKSGTGTGTVTSSPVGINCGATCNTAFNQSTLVTLTATPAAGSTFSGWTGACSGTGTCTVSMNSAVNVGANFTQNIVTYTLTVTKSGTGAGQITSSPAGINCTTSCSAQFNQGTFVTLTATPAAGSSFSGWTGSCTGTGTCSVTMNGAANVYATFTANPTDFTLSVSKTGNGFGTITSSPAGISCGSTCSASFTQGTTVTLQPNAATGSTFTGWSGACSGAGSCTVTLNNSASVTANYSLNTINPTVTVSKTGDGIGIIASFPAGISCGTTCTTTFAQGTMLNLSATPDTNNTFTGWSGACTGSNSICSLTLNSSISASANFIKNVTNYNLSVSKTGSGTISSIPAGVDCGTYCSASFPQGTAVSLTASAAAGWSFSGWSGACTGTGSCVVNMNSNSFVGANFTQNTITYGLTVFKAGLGSGLVTSAPSGISCGTTCTTSFNQNTAVTLTATPSAGSTFSGWSGACTGTGTCTVTMNSATNVTATFAQVPVVTNYTLSVTKTGGLGTITSSPAGISCGAYCNAPYSAGTVVTLTATPVSGTTFIGWSGACTGTGTCTVTMNSAMSVSAAFQGPTADTIAPTVYISAPVSGSSVPSGSRVTILANASDNVALSHVTFYNKGVLLGQDATAPYSFITGSLKSGTHTFTARAYDTSNNSTLSSAVSVNVLRKTSGRVSKQLYLGMVDPQVLELQTFLNDNGFTVATSGAGSPGNETTYFGKGTYNALIGFQERYADEILKPNGLRYGNGVAGPSTRSKINELSQYLEETEIETEAEVLQ